MQLFTDGNDILYHISNTDITDVLIPDVVVPIRSHQFVKLIKGCEVSISEQRGTSGVRSFKVLSDAVISQLVQ